MSRTKLTLGKGSSFVKSRLRRLSQKDDAWEADFQPIPNERKTEFWLGMVVEQETAIELTHEVLSAPPTVNDLASLIAAAMQRPIIEGSHHRPSTLLLSNDPHWKELIPHLMELGIEVIVSGTLPAWKQAAEESGVEHARMMFRLGPPKTTKDNLVAAMFPALGKWILSGGWIEIGEQDGVGFVVRALDAGGLAFEDTEARTLDEALAALEAGIAGQLEEHGIDLG